MNESTKWFGLVPAHVAKHLSGIDFVKGLLEGSLPSPPFAEISDVWPVSVEVGHIGLEGTPSARFYSPMWLVHGGWLALLLGTAMNALCTRPWRQGRAVRRLISRRRSSNRCAKERYDFAVRRPCSILADELHRPREKSWTCKVDLWRTVLKPA